MFDEAGQRYIEFTKNRRGGSGVGKRLYFRLEDGEVIYDGNRYEETNELKEIEDKESIRQIDLSQKFEEIFINGANVVEDEKTELQKKIEAENEVDDVEFEIIKPENENK
jgi:hypothetical protein